jgi:hypothetical protein
MLVAVLLALAVTVAAVGYATYVLVRRTIELFRAFRTFQGSTGEAVERLETTLRFLEARTDAASRSAERLEPQLRRLRTSQAQLSVLSGAVADVAASVGRVRSLQPRK